MSETKLIRPNQVTMAGWMIMVGSVIVVITVFDQMAALRSIETREGIQKFLSEPPGEGLGLTVDSTLRIIKAVSLVAAGCATAAAILGWQVLRRDRGARLALTILAVPLFITGVAAGGFFSALIAASSLILWSQPARDWFDGRVRPSEPPAGQPVARPAAQSPAPPAPSPTPSAPAAYPNFGVPHPAARPAPMRRPEPVVWAAVLTWIFSGLTLVVLGVSGVLFATDSEAVITEARKRQSSVDTSTLSDQMIIAGVFMIIVVIALWAITAAVLAGLTWRGLEWARIALVVSAALAGALSLVGALANLAFLPLPIACGVVLRLLLNGRAAAWCRRPRVMD